MKTILVVDDQEDIVKLIRECLESAGYAVHAVFSGKDAIAALSIIPLDLAICDVMMPDIGGIEVLRRIRHSPALRDTPVVMLTARSGTSDMADALYLGADLYLTKPLNPGELLSVVRRLLPEDPDTGVPT